MTDITRSMIVCGKEFTFPIDFSRETAICLTGDKQWTETYAVNQARLLLHSRKIASLPINETHSYHREKMNEHKPDPLRYEVGNFVLAKRAVKSVKAKNQVDKAQYAYTGPWEVIKKLQGGSYNLKHTTSGKLDKKHTMHLQPVLPELLSFAPLDGVDTRYGQLYRNVNDAAFKATGCDGFLPHNLFKNIKELTATLPSGTRSAPFPHFPTLAELNAEMIMTWNPASPNAEMLDRSEEEIEAAMLPDDNEDFVDEPFLSMPSIPVAATKPTCY